MLKVSERNASFQVLKPGYYLCLTLLTAGLLSGCNGQKIANPLAKLKFGSLQQKAVPEQGAEVTGSVSSDVSTKLVQGENETLMLQAVAAARAQSAVEHQKDQITTGSIDPSTADKFERPAGPGKGRTQVERISNTVSASCRRVLAEAGIETTLLRSPSINGSVNQDEDISIGTSYDLLDLRRANLKDEMAIAQCARDDAAAKLAQLLVTSNQSHSQAGYRAKSVHLKQRRAAMATIRRSIENGLKAGDLTIFQANGLRQGLRRLQSEAARAEGEASKRQIVRRIQGQSYEDLDQQLAKAEDRLQQLEAGFRTADALNLKASLGYSQRGSNSDDLTISEDGEVTAKLAVTMRLGAYSPRRRELEAIARSARRESLYETNRGVLWRSQEAARVNRKVVGSLERQREKVSAALASARLNADSGLADGDSDILAAQLKARIDVVRLGAELAALDATFADTGRLDINLNFRN